MGGSVEEFALACAAGPKGGLVGTAEGGEDGGDVVEDLGGGKVHELEGLAKGDEGVVVAPLEVEDPAEGVEVGVLERARGERAVDEVERAVEVAPLLGEG